MADDHREDANKTYRTKTGKELSDADVDAMTDEVEGGYDVEMLKTRLRSRPSMGSARDDIYARLRPAAPTPPDEICACSVAKPVKLMVALGDNPIHCLDCNLEVEPSALQLPADMVDAVAHWCSIAGAIERLELDSGPYEQWSQAQLLDPQSPVNREGLELRQRLDGVRRCYYVFFQPLADEGFVVPDGCPICHGTFSDYRGGIFPQRICESCSIVLVNE